LQHLQGDDTYFEQAARGSERAFLSRVGFLHQAHCQERVLPVQIPTTCILSPSQAAPDHGVFGEEQGLKPGSGAGADYMWVLDPIDGTKSFITGKHTRPTLWVLILGNYLLGEVIGCGHRFSQRTMGIASLEESSRKPAVVGQMHCNKHQPSQLACCLVCK
jgi:hypothetical protein